ncbi:AraC family transcriptional regulator [Muricoccus radiodurans]|uniref:AraC family transcriptional regulator n=1 Tax=Muricoccus radiodurans TaxID=2231721 RepID=UPI003CF6237B
MTPPGGDRVRLVRDPATGAEAIRARFAAHAYDLHRHDEWLVGVTDRGVQDFHHRGTRQRSTPGRIILIEPEEAHDGQAGSAEGFSYRMLYLPRPWLRASLGEGGDPGFRTGLTDDPPLGRAIRAACAALAGPEGRLARDAALDAVLERLRPHLGRLVSHAGAGRDARVARRARERLHDDLAADPGADALAAAAGAADRFRLARAFRAAYGVSPHAYLVQIRLLHARHLLAAGERPAAVAASCGFADQSHLGRWFRRAYGLTPAAYRALCTGVPDAAA